MLRHAHLMELANTRSLLRHMYFLFNAHTWFMLRHVHLMELANTQSLLRHVSWTPCSLELANTHSQLLHVDSCSTLKLEKFNKARNHTQKDLKSHVLAMFNFCCKSHRTSRPMKLRCCICSRKPKQSEYHSQILLFFLKKEGNADLTTVHHKLIRCAARAGTLLHFSKK